MRRIVVSAADFDPGQELALLGETGAGAVASFIGLVRGDGGLLSMTLEHYPAMTEAALAAIADEATKRWPLDGVVLMHRVGLLHPGDRIVLTATASRHRAAAIEACAFLIDWLKTDAPFWKKECFADGRETWVDARATDDAARARWK